MEIKNSPSEPMAIKRVRLDHKKGAEKMAFNCQVKPNRGIFKKLFAAIKYFFGKRNLDPNSFPDGEFITLDKIKMNTHMGTHIDAPIHFGSMCEGKKAKSIDELPIDYFYGDGVKLDFRHKKAGEEITETDIKKELERVNYILKEGDIVLIWTNASRYLGKKEYFDCFPGMSMEATRYIVNSGIKVIGIDAYGFDRPFKSMIRDFVKTKDNKYLWPSHLYGRKKEYFHIERLINLDKLPDKNFKICCFPLKIVGADASWIRAVGMIE
jgi:kynurenine formamidase